MKFSKFLIEQAAEQKFVQQFKNYIQSISEEQLHELADLWYSVKKQQTPQQKK